MKNLLFVMLLSLVIFSGCKEKTKRPEDKKPSISEEAALDEIYQNINEHPDYKEYEKISDTSFYDGGFDPEFGIMGIQKGENKLVIFKDNLFDENSRKIGFTILDTLQIGILAENEVLSIGYCYENSDDTINIIAIYEKTEEQNPQNIIKAWKANPVSRKIEEIDVKNLYCWNEHFNGIESSKI